MPREKNNTYFALFSTKYTYILCCFSGICVSNTWGFTGEALEKNFQYDEFFCYFERKTRLVLRESRGETHRTKKCTCVTGLYFFENPIRRPRGTLLLKYNQLIICKIDSIRLLIIEQILFLIYRSRCSGFNFLQLFIIDKTFVLDLSFTQKYFQKVMLTFAYS